MDLLSPLMSILDNAQKTILLFTTFLFNEPNLLNIPPINNDVILMGQIDVIQKICNCDSNIGKTKVSNMIIEHKTMPSS